MTAGRFSKPWLLSVLLFILLSLLIVLPVAYLVREALVVRGEINLDALREFIATPGIGKTIANTIILTVFASILATILGVVLAISATLVPAGPVMRRVLQFAPLVPLTIPALVGTLGWLFLLSPRTGWLNIAYRSVFDNTGTTGPLSIISLSGAIWVVSLYTVPYVYTVMVASLSRVNSETMEAMLVCGERPAHMLLRIVGGSLRPALFAACTLALLESVSQFSAPLLLQVDVLTTYIYRNANLLNRAELSAAASLPLLVVAIALTLVQLRFMQHSNRFVTVTGKGSSGRAVPLSKGAATMFKTASIAYLILTGILPVLAIIVVSLLPYWQPSISLSDMSFAHYRAVLGNTHVMNGLRNSLFLGFVCSVASIVVILLVLILAERLKQYWAKAALLVANLPLGIPHIVLGLGFLVAFISPPVVLYGTIWLLILAYVVSFLPLAARNIGPLLQQVGGELEEAARICGASWPVVLRKVTLPLIAPGIAGAFIILFIILFREFPIASFVSTPGTNVISLSLLNFFQNGEWPRTAVVAVFISAVSFVGITVSLIFGQTRLGSSGER